MPTVNILKQVRARARPTNFTNLTTKRQKPAAKKAPIKSNFNARNPYDYFVGKSAPEINTSIDEVFKRPDFFERTQLLTVLNRVKATVPMSLLELFFVTAKRSGAAEGFEAVARRPEYAEMRNILQNRAAERGGNNSRPSQQIKVNEPQHRLPKREVKIKLLKYSRPELQTRTIEELYDLANRENLRLTAGLTKSQLINSLLAVESTATAYKERPFTTELLPICESEYRRAPWMKAFGLSVIGIALKKGDGFETNARIENDWYAAKATWYSNVCKIGRQFNPDTVGYIISAPLGKRRVVVETLEMYNASLNRTKSASQKLKTTRQVPALQHSVSALSIVSKQAEQHTSAQPVALRLQSELAPGLFRYVRKLISGTTLCCSNCNATVPAAKIRSINENKQVVFCGTECFRDYEFN